MRKLFEKESLDFLQKNAEKSLKNLKHFSFSDLEIVSKSAQKVCAKLAEKMRNQIQDEELGEILVNIQGKFKSEGHTFKNHKEMISFFQQRLGHYKGKPWLQEQDLKNEETGEDFTEAKSEIEKGLFEILFPEGHRLRDIELRGDVFFQRSESDKPSEAFDKVKTTVC